MLHYIEHVKCRNGYPSDITGHQGNSLRHTLGQIGEQTYVFSDCLPYRNAAVYGYTSVDARNEANASMPRYFTKRDLLRYLVRVSPYMLPHLENRPLTMIRMPEGINGERFFQKHWSQARPGTFISARSRTKQSGSTASTRQKSRVLPGKGVSGSRRPRLIPNPPSNQSMSPRSCQVQSMAGQPRSPPMRAKAR